MPMLTKDNMFTCEEMTDAVNKLPLMPSRFASLFDETGVRTTSVAVELKKNRITLIQDAPRDADPEFLGGRGEKREIKHIQTTHLAQADVLRPDDIQDVRAFGSTELTTAASVVNDKIVALKRNMEMTREMHRLGAIKGVIMDADGTTEILNLFDLFGVTRKKINITFPATATDSENPVLNAILSAKRKAENAMGGNYFERLEAIVGSNFYDMLTGHALVRSYFQDWLARQRDFGDNDYRKRGFTYGRVTFYEASEIVGGMPLVDSDKGYLYPVGPGIYKTYNAPAAWMETVNTIGLPYYARMWEHQFSRGYYIEVQANPLTLCLYPEALVELTAQKG